MKKSACFAVRETPFDGVVGGVIVSHVFGRFA
jgi:hypothetical protein